MDTATKLRDLTVGEFKTLISDTIKENIEDLLERFDCSFKQGIFDLYKRSKRGLQAWKSEESR